MAGGDGQGVSGSLNKQCQVCDRVRASFYMLRPTLHPLPINGLFLRRGPVPACEFKLLTPSGSRYIMVCIEYCSKSLVLRALPNKDARTTALAFATGVLV